MKEQITFLIVNTFGIGDVLFSTPLVRNLSNNFPESKIIYLCNERNSQLLEFHPLIDRVLVYERDEFERIKEKSKFKWLKKIFNLLSSLKKGKIDVSIDLSLNPQFSFYAFLLGIKKRIGFDYKNRGRFLTHKLNISGFEEKHVADYYLNLLRFIDCPTKRYDLEVYTDKQSETRTVDFLNTNNISDNNPIIGIAPCGGMAFGKNAYRKRWPEEKFSTLIDKLVEELDAVIFIFAGLNERKEVLNILNSVKERSKCFEFTHISLKQMIALIKRCKLFIGNDTGPLRFADALNKNIIALFGPVDEKVYGLYPYKQSKQLVIKKDLNCRPCYKKFRLPKCNYKIRCLNDITVDEVFVSAKKLIEDEK